MQKKTTDQRKMVKLKRLETTIGKWAMLSWTYIEFSPSGSGCLQPESDNVCGRRHVSCTLITTHDRQRQSRLNFNTIFIFIISPNYQRQWVYVYFGSQSWNDEKLLFRKEKWPLIKMTFLFKMVRCWQSSKLWGTEKWGCARGGFYLFL